MMSQLGLILLSVFLLWQGIDAIRHRTTGIGFGRPKPIIGLMLEVTSAVILGAFSILTAIIFLFVRIYLHLTTEIENKEFVATIVIIVGLGFIFFSLIIAGIIQYAVNLGKNKGKQKAKNN